MQHERTIKYLQNSKYIIFKRPKIILAIFVKACSRKLDSFSFCNFHLPAVSFYHETPLDGSLVKQYTNSFHYKK